MANLRNSRDIDIRLAQLRDDYDTLQAAISSLGCTDEERRKRLADRLAQTESEARDICAYGS